MLQRSNILTFPLNYFVNGPVKLALVVWKATEGKSVMVVHDVSCAGNIFPCLGCKTPGSGLYNGWGVTSCPCSSTTWRSKYKNNEILLEILFLFFHKKSYREYSTTYRFIIKHPLPVQCVLVFGPSSCPELYCHLLSWSSFHWLRVDGLCYALIHTKYSRRYIQCFGWPGRKKTCFSQ